MQNARICIPKCFCIRCALISYRIMEIIITIIAHMRGRQRKRFTFDYPAKKKYYAMLQFWRQWEDISVQKVGNGPLLNDDKLCQTKSFTNSMTNVFFDSIYEIIKFSTTGKSQLTALPTFRNCLRLLAKKWTWKFWTKHCAEESTPFFLTILWKVLAVSK